MPVALCFFKPGLITAIVPPLLRTLPRLKPPEQKKQHYNKKLPADNINFNWRGQLHNLYPEYQHQILSASALRQIVFVHHIPHVQEKFFSP